MWAARLHGPADLRVERVPRPGPPGSGEVLIRVAVTGICGSDLHSFADARIGDTRVESPLVLGHEFSGVVEQAGPEAMDGHFQPLAPGARVAVDPAQPCHHCEMCEQGQPNLCLNLRFCSNHPYDGSLCEWLIVPARCCFPVPPGISDIQAALLEPLGVALHAVDLAKIRVGDSVAILGAGFIGLCILQLARLSGAAPVFVSDKFDWRLKEAMRLGAVALECDPAQAPAKVLEATRKRGVDVVIEAAWGDQSVGQAAEMARMGGRVVLVGIPSDDRLTLKHSTARRKGLTIRLCRRMKHTYPRAIALALDKRIELGSLVSHRFSLQDAPKAFQLNAAYEQRVLKAVIFSHAP